MAQRVRGEGSVFWSESQDRYVATATAGTARKQFYGPRGAKTREAKLGVVHRLDAWVAAHPRSVSRLTIETYATRSITATELRSKTRYGYEGLIERYIRGTAFGRKRIGDIAPKDVRSFIDSIAAGAATRRSVYAFLHRTFEHAIATEDLVLNPAHGVKKPTVARVEYPIWTPDQAIQFLRVARQHRLYALFVLALTTTMGPAELFGLQWSAVSLDGAYLIVRNDLVDIGGKLALETTKNRKRTRRIDLPKLAVAALAAHPMNGGHVFTAPGGEPLRLSNFRQREWLPLLKIAQVPVIRFYDLRHTANALMGHIGVPIEIASRRMGHASIQQTVDTYGHHYEHQQKDVAERLDVFLAQLED